LVPTAGRCPRPKSDLRAVEPFGWRLPVQRVVGGEKGAGEQNEVLAGNEAGFVDRPHQAAACPPPARIGEQQQGSLNRTIGPAPMSGAKEHQRLEGV